MPTKRQLEYYGVYKRLGSIRATAKEFGVNYTAARQAIKACELAGMTVRPDRFHEKIPVGAITGKITTQVDYRKDPAGEVVTEWVRSSPGDFPLEMLQEYLSARIPASSLPLGPPPDNCDPEIMLQIDLADAHYGMLSWGKETGGGDYDMSIARRLILETMAEIYARSGPVNETLLVFYGDNFHADFFSAVTEKSRHHLDTDSRYSKMIFSGAETFISAVEIAVAHSEHVRVIVLYGNHDTQSSVNLQLVLHTHFRLADPGRVLIDLEPSRARYHVWGCTAQVYHHGDGTKPERLAADIMRYVAEHDIPGVREYRANQAHLHRESSQDINGVLYECKPSPVARDAYAAGALWLSRRACIATTFHRRFGELTRYTITPRALAAKLQKIN
jgi:hypothetical protein